MFPSYINQSFVTSTFQFFFTKVKQFLNVAYITILQTREVLILTETLACFLPGRAKDLSAPL